MWSFFYQFYISQGGNYTGLIYWLHISGALVLFALSACVLVLVSRSIKNLSATIIFFGIVSIILAWHLEKEVILLPMMAIIAYSVIKIPLYGWTKYNSISWATINLLLYSSIILSMVYASMGLHMWGLFPTREGFAGQLPFQLAIFPYANSPISGFIAVCILAVTLFKRGERSLIWWLTLFVSIYFLLFSFGRTALLACIAVFTTYFLVTFFRARLPFIIFSNIVFFAFSCVVIVYPQFIFDYISELSIVNELAMLRGVETDSSDRGLMIQDALSNNIGLIGIGWSRTVLDYLSFGGSEIALFFYISAYGYLGICVLFGSFLFFFSKVEIVSLGAIMLFHYAFYSSFSQPYSATFLFLVLCISALRESRESIYVNGSSIRKDLKKPSSSSHAY